MNWLRRGIFNESKEKNIVEKLFEPQTAGTHLIN